MSKRMPELLPDPDFPEFDGVYVGDKENPYKLQLFPYHIPSLSRYAQEQGKNISELTAEECEQFRVRPE